MEIRKTVVCPLLFKGEPYRPWQTASNTLTGAIAFPLGGKSWLLDGLLGATTNATNTVVTNAAYGKSDDVSWSAGLGFVFGALGNPVQGYVNTATSTAVSGIPSLFPYWMPQPPIPGGSKP